MENILQENPLIHFVQKNDGSLSTRDDVRKWLCKQKFKKTHTFNFREFLSEEIASFSDETF